MERTQSLVYHGQIILGNNMGFFYPLGNSKGIYNNTSRKCPQQYPMTMELKFKTTGVL